MRTEFVELIDCAIRIPAEAHEPLRAAIGEIFQWREFEDVEQALSVYDLLVVEYDEVDAIVGLERDPGDDSWPGDELYALLAPHVESDNYLVFRYRAYDGENCRLEDRLRRRGRLPPPARRDDLRRGLTCGTPAGDHWAQ